MRILHVTHSDRGGGAGIAAHRLVIAERAAGMDAHMQVLDRRGDEDWVHEAPLATRLRARMARAIGRRLARRGAASEVDSYRTLARVDTGLGRAIERLRPDLVHWHWVGAESLSLAEMADLALPCVWTCHDEWAWCGAEHYPPDERFISGYSGTDIDARVFARKQLEWQNFSPVLVGPSRWIAGRAGQSLLFGKSRAEVIPNTLDIGVFAPMERQEARLAMGIPADSKVVLFGAQNGPADPRKGFDLLCEALGHMQGTIADEIVCVSFGGARATGNRIAGLDHVEWGPVSDEAKLAALYNAADLFVAPSRMDNLPNTMLEALACGTPCAGFAIGGLADLVSTPDHGELVPAFDTGALAAAIQRLLEREDDGVRARIRADVLARFSPEVIAARHAALYRELLEGVDG